MFNAKPTQELFDSIKSHYTETSRQTSATGRILNVLKSNPNAPIVNTLMNWCSEITSRESLIQVIGSLNGITTLLEDPEVKKSLQEVADQVTLLKDALPFESEDLKVLSKERVDEYLLSLETATQRALSFLAVRAGLTASDVLREVNGLQKVSSGIVEIGPRTSSNMPQGRTIEDIDTTFLNEELDPAGDVMKLIAGYKVRSNTIGLDGLAIIGSQTNNLPYTLTQLRTSHAIHLLQDGKSWDEVAEVQGVSKVSLRDRVMKYTAANNITL